MSNISRRNWIAGGVAGAAGVAVAAGIGAPAGWLPPDAKGVYGCGHTLTYAAQRFLTGKANAREFSRNQISKVPHPRGKGPKGEEYARMHAAGFSDWRLKVDGMVSRPASLSLAEIKSYPSRGQITQVICEEGWSYIAEWRGVPLAHVLDLTGVDARAKYAVYRAMDGWLDAIDIDEARHEQTLVTYEMNTAEIPVGHGGPLRMRVPKQLAYKSLKFLNRVTLTDTLEGVPLGKSYSWYAGI